MGWIPFEFRGIWSYRTSSLKHINVLLIFSIFDAIDACLLVHGSWLKAHGSWPREARGGSWLMARGRPGPGDPEARFRSGSGPAIMQFFRIWCALFGPYRAFFGLIGSFFWG